METIENNNLIELEKILSFLGIIFIDYKGNRTSDGHKTAKTIGEIKVFFGKEVMTSGQFIKDINWWDFKNNYNDLFFLVEKIEEIQSPKGFRYAFEICGNSVNIGLGKTENIFKRKTTKKESIYSACLEFIEWHNQQNN